MGQLAGVAAGQPVAQPGSEPRAEPGGGDRRVEHLVAGAVKLQRLLEQAVQVEHLDAALDERVGERVVLLARALDPEDVVEQQRVLVARRQPLELAVGPVQQHPPQRPDLRADVCARGGLDAHVGTSVAAMVISTFR